MIINSIQNIFLSFFALFIFVTPFEADVLDHDWVSVPKSQYGKQLWDKNSLHKNQDGSIRALSKFIPETTTDITQEILYRMDINCLEESFKDVGLDEKELNEFNNRNSEWIDPNGDKLIIGVISQVCTYEN